MEQKIQPGGHRRTGPVSQCSAQGSLSKPQVSLRPFPHTPSNLANFRLVDSRGTGIRGAQRMCRGVTFTDQAKASRWLMKGANLLHLGITKSETAGCGQCTL